MTPATSSVLTSKKPLDAHEWLADTEARSAFYDDLQDFLIRAIAQQTGQQTGHVRHHLKLYWSDSLNRSEDDYFWMFTDEPTAEEQERADQDDFLEALRDAVITVEGIHFPAIDTVDQREDYHCLFSPIENLHFSDCHFYDEQIFTENIVDRVFSKVCFTDCIFHTAWHVTEGYAPKSSSVLFDQCQFKREVIIDGLKVHSFSESGYTSVFKDCHLNQVSIKSAVIDVKLFEFSKEQPAKLKSLKIESCTFDAVLALANIKGIETLEFSSTVFNKKFALIGCQCSQVIIKDTNFKEVASFYAATFASFQLQKSKFLDFAGFEKCQFGTRKATSIEAITLKYVIFYSFINFRDAVFNQPLDLRNTNSKEQPNFLDATFTAKAAASTDRETFRIIKHSFDAVGNHIEANKYFAYEMQAYRRELKKKAQAGTQSHRRERLLLWVNAVVSEHGQDYWRAALWFVAVIGITGLVVANDNHKWFIAPTRVQYWLQFIGEPFNSFALGFLPLTALFKDKEHLAFFLFLAALSLSGLTWHLLVAVRRHSKR